MFINKVMALFQQKPKTPRNGKNGGETRSLGAGLFGGQKKKDGPDLTGINEELNNISRKIRLIEDHNSNFQKKYTVSEQNLVSRNKRLSNEIKAINTEMLELRHLIDTLDNKLLLIIKELKLCAKKEKVELLTRYINLWEPIKFVTRREVERIVEEIIENRNDTEK